MDMQDKVVVQHVMCCNSCIFLKSSLNVCCSEASNRTDFPAVEMHKAGPDCGSCPTVDHDSSVSRSRTLSHLMLADGNG